MDKMSAEKKHNGLSTAKAFENFCRYDGKLDQSESRFVGVKIEKNGEPIVYFPYGYRPDALKNNIDELDAELKSDFYRLIGIISHQSLREYFPDDEKKDIIVNFPIHSFFFVIQYYQDFGFFKETEIIEKNGATGKVDWRKTIKRIKPQIVKNKDDHYNIVYLDLIARKTNYKEDSLITLIHKYCVYEAANIIGPLLGVSKNDFDEPEIDKDYDLFIDVLNEKISSTFNDRFLELFRSMLAIIEFLKGKEFQGNKSSDVAYGVEKFDRAWEMMIDKIFGNAIDKSAYNPHCKWTNGNEDSEEYEEEVDVESQGIRRSTLRPDTIMERQIKNDRLNVFVLDSKYYKFGVEEKKVRLNKLPGAESICKQMAYAEYVKNDFGKNKDNFAAYKEKTIGEIYNAFIMPYCADAGRWDGPDMGKESYYMRKAGYVFGDWKDLRSSALRDCPYHKIHCILLDMKSVMRNYSANSDAQKALADLILRSGA